MLHTSSHEAARTEKGFSKRCLSCGCVVPCAGGNGMFRKPMFCGMHVSLGVLASRWLMDAPVPAVASVEEAVDYFRQLEERVYDLSTAVRHLQASLNTTNLRLDTLEQQVARLEFQTSGSHGGGIKAELAIVSRIVSDVVESVNRTEAETGAPRRTAQHRVSLRLSVP